MYNLTRLHVGSLRRPPRRRLTLSRERIARRASSSCSSRVSITTSAGDYDTAIHVWTRALFLDRGHARARAYIERARSAQAERQRESEELLHRGVAAFDRGETATPRTADRGVSARAPSRKWRLSLSEAGSIAWKSTRSRVRTPSESRGTSRASQRPATVAAPMRVYRCAVPPACSANGGDYRVHLCCGRVGRRRIF